MFRRVKFEQFQRIVEGDELVFSTTGTGHGIFLCDGVMQDITWSKADHKSPLTYQTLQGEPLQLGVGSSYINIVGDSAEVSVG